MFEELSRVLGGVVIINGVCYYSHGVLQKQMFVKDPLDRQANAYYLAKDFKVFTLAMKRIVRGEAFLGCSGQSGAWTGQVDFEEWLDEQLAFTTMGSMQIGGRGSYGALS